MVCDHGGMLISSPNNITNLTLLVQGMGFTKNWKDMLACRIILGLLEAGLSTTSHVFAVGRGLIVLGYFPGCVYLLSSWYVRCKYQHRRTILRLLISIDDVQKRFSVFYLIGCVASALSGILAFGLMQADGREGLEGWRWIFILEGVVREMNDHLRML